MDGLDIDVSDLQSPTGTLGRVLALSAVALACRCNMHFMNRTTIKNAAAVDMIIQRDSRDNRPLITVSNHTSTLDDPCLPCAFLPFKFFTQEANHRGTRWVFCADNICFTNPVYRAFFLSGKTLPVVRGGGVEQPNLQAVAWRLGQYGDWLHIFPEGCISFDGKLGELKRGVGKMVCDVMKYGDGRPPIVLPYYHSGMGDIMPYGARFPRMGHNVTITFGEPVALEALACDCNKTGVDQEALWHAIAHKVREALLDLEARSVANTDQVKAGLAPDKHVAKT